MSGFRRPTLGWLVTRIEMAIAVLAVGLAVTAPMISPWYQPVTGGMPYLPVVSLTGIGGTIVGAVLVFRIARRDPESGRSSWRYRDR